MIHEVGIILEVKPRLHLTKEKRTRRGGRGKLVVDPKEKKLIYYQESGQKKFLHVVTNKSRDSSRVKKLNQRK